MSYLPKAVEVYSIRNEHSSSKIASFRVGWGQNQSFLGMLVTYMSSFRRIRRCSLTATKEEAPKEESEDIKAAAMALTSLSLSPGAKSHKGMI